MLLSPPGRCRALPAQKGSGQARVPNWSRQLGSSPLGTFAAQGTSALTATHSETVAAGAAHRLARPLAQSGRPRRPSVPDRRPANALLRGAVTVGSRQTLHSSPSRSFRSRFSVCQPCRFNPSQPPKGGAITPGLRRRFESPSVPGSAS